MELAQAALAKKLRLGTYRSFLVLDRSTSESLRYPYFQDVQGNVLLHMCLNDYLGFSQSEKAVAAARASLESGGVGSGASRNIGGTRSEHMALEAALSVLHGAEDCLIYTTGNAANSDVVSVMARLSDSVTFFSDSENHASLIDPMRGLGPRKSVFAHNDVDDLKRKFRKVAKQGDYPVLVVESLYSMSGDYCNLADLLFWFKEQGGTTILNEVHAVGVEGAKGCGRCGDLRASSGVDILVGSLSKAWGVSGGYICGRREYVDLCRQSGVRSIFTTSPPPYVCAAALSNIQERGSSDERSIDLRQKTRLLKQCLQHEGIDYLGAEESHIVPVLIGGEDRCVSVSTELIKQGYYVTPVRYPTVPRGSARIRITLNPYHPMAGVFDFCSALGRALRASCP